MRSAAAGELSSAGLAEVVRERVRFAGPAGSLSGELAYPERSAPTFAALLGGPHPYMGGSMNNALVEAVALRLAAVGGVVLRFDYGGTGASDGPPIDVARSMSEFWRTGHAPEDPDRIADVAAANEFVASLEVSPIVLAGYSFGCYAVLRAWIEAAAQLPAPAGVVLISPTVARHDFTALDTGRFQPPPALLVIHSANDFATPLECVARWVDTWPHPQKLSVLDSTNHFFRGAEGELAGQCARFAITAAGGQPAAEATP